VRLLSKLFGHLKTFNLDICWSATIRHGHNQLSDYMSPSQGPPDIFNQDIINNSNKLYHVAQSQESIHCW
jgi:hypothetical protein